MALDAELQGRMLGVIARSGARMDVFLDGLNHLQGELEAIMVAAGYRWENGRYIELGAETRDGAEEEHQETEA